MVSANTAHPTVKWLTQLQYLGLETTGTAQPVFQRQSEGIQDQRSPFHQRGRSSVAYDWIFGRRDKDISKL